jgi:hypothetical protein
MKPHLLSSATISVLALLWPLTAPVQAVNLNTLAAEYAGLPRTENADGAVRAEVVRSPEKTRAPWVSAGKAAWDAYEKTIGVPLRKWAAEEIAPPKGGTVFYPFSGPDFVTVAQMFPEADRYVLVAIQPAGPVVDLAAMNEGASSAFKAKFEAEWHKFGQLGFFRTVDLNENTAHKVTPLTSTPVMMAFAAALGYRVESVRPIQMNAESGDFEDVQDPAASRWNSVRLGLRRGEKLVTLDYICLDLSDGFLKTHAAELRWIRAMAKNPVLLKAASHLLPKSYFSACREAIVEGAPLLVQDETGLEYPDLKKMGSVKLYGRFAGVLSLFDPNSQRALAEAYAAAGQTSPLPFAYSYQKSSDRRSLQVVRRESSAR